MKRNTIKKLACSAIAGGMLLTCAASVSAFAASDEATAYVFIRDVDNKFIYEGEANDKTNTIAVKGDSDSKREENGTVTTEKITEDKKGVTVSLDLGSNTITPTDFALKLDGAEHAKNVKISDVKLKLDGKEVELSAEPKADVKDDEITLFIYRSSGDNIRDMLISGNGKYIYSATSAGLIRTDLETWGSEAIIAIPKSHMYSNLLL